MSSQNIESKDQQDLSPEAKELNALKEELLLFASLINHDFKEPVRTISAFSSLLGRRIEEEDSKSQELLGFIQDGAVRMGSMIEALVEYIRIEHYMDSSTEIDCSEIILELQAIFAKKYESKNIKINSESLGQIHAAPNSIRKLFKHILTNAIVFQNQDAEPLIQITGSTDTNGQNIYFDDNGIGVPENLLEQIFHPFRRLNAIGTYKGCGLGLAGCKKIMDLHNGTIQAKKSPLGGLRIAVFFPKKQANAAT